MAASRRRELASLFALLLPLLGGCGIVQVESDDPPRADWPLLVDTASDERPTALVRLELPAEESDGADELLTSFSAPFSAGLFSSVSYQVGTDHMATRADYVLDMEVDQDTEGAWYTVVGAATLGCLPIPLHTEHVARVRVRDADGRLLGTTDATGTITQTMWIPLLPLNLAFATVDLLGLGTLLGLNPQRWDTDERAFVENLVRVALDRAHRQFHFSRPGPRPPVTSSD